MAEPCIAVNPVVRSLAVQCPVRFIRMNGVIAAAELFGDVFLKMLSGGGFLEDPHASRAVRTFFRCRHVHGPVVLRGRFTKPTRMADRGSTLLLVRY